MYNDAHFFTQRCILKSAIDTTLSPSYDELCLETILSLDLQSLLKRKGLNPRLFEDEYAISFDEGIAQHAAWAFRHIYSIPYYSLSALDNPGGIARFYHGIQHVSRSAMYAPIFANLFRRYGYTHALKLTNRALKLVQIALIFHDCAREDEEEDLWDHESGTFLYFYLTRVLKIATSEAKKIAEALANKDWLYGENYKSLTEIEGEVVWLLKKRAQPKTIYHQLIHDCDCLDVIRARTVFKGKNLDFYKEVVKNSRQKEALNDMVELIIRAKSLIATQGDTFGDTNPELKKKFETEASYTSVLQSVLHGDFALFKMLYADGELLSTKELASLTLIDDTNLLNKHRILARGLIAPTAISCKILKNQEIETLADVEFRKAKRRKNVMTTTSKSNGLTKEGNPNRSFSLLGGSVFADVGCLLFNPNEKVIKAVYAVDADTGWGKKQAYNPNYDDSTLTIPVLESDDLSKQFKKLTIGFGINGNQALDKLEKKMKLGGAARFFKNNKVIASHNEILCDVTEYDAIYYTNDPTFANKIFHGHAKNTSHYSSILKAIHLQLAYQKAYGKLLPIYEYSGIHYYLKKIAPFMPEQLCEMWFMMCSCFIKDKIQKGEIKELRDYSIQEIMILSMYPKVTHHFFYKFTDACHHYSRPLSRRIEKLISETRDSLILTHQSRTLRSLYDCFQDISVSTELTTKQCYKLAKVYNEAGLAQLECELILFLHEAHLYIQNKLDEKKDCFSSVSSLVRLACILKLIPLIKPRLDELGYFSLIQFHDEAYDPDKDLRLSDLLIALDLIVRQDGRIDLAYLTVLEISNGLASNFILLNRFHQNLDKGQQRFFYHFFKVGEVTEPSFNDSERAYELRK